MNLGKTPEINLSKGQKIDLKKGSGETLSKVCLGLNWSKIEVKGGGMFGFGGGTRLKDVDLDASCTSFDSNGREIETISYRQLQSKYGYINHSGDDTGGDDEDDGLDNEVIVVDMSKAPENTQEIYFYLNSFSGDKFDEIPNIGIRIYEGTPTQVNYNFAEMKVHNDVNFSGKIAMILGKLYKRNGAWKFETFGEATNDRDINSVISTIKQKYL